MMGRLYTFCLTFAAPPSSSAPAVLRCRRKLFVALSVRNAELRCEQPERASGGRLRNARLNQRESVPDAAPACEAGAIRRPCLTSHRPKGTLMQPQTEASVRKSFINCSKGAASRIGIPPAVLDADWDKQFFLAWSDPKSPQNAYVVAETEDGLRGISMEKRSAKGSGGARMCQLCLALHSSTGVSMVSIPTTKSSKDSYGSVGGYICTDLACVDYTLGTKKPEGVRQMEETLTQEERIERTLGNVQRLIASVAEKLK